MVYGEFGKDLEIIFDINFADDSVIIMDKTRKTTPAPGLNDLCSGTMAAFALDIQRSEIGTDEIIREQKAAVSSRHGIKSHNLVPWQLPILGY